MKILRMKLQSEKVVIPRVISAVKNALAQEMMKDKKAKEVFGQEENTIVTDHSKENPHHNKEAAPVPADGFQRKKRLEVIFWVVFLFLLGVIAGVLFLF